jgi:putative PIN family toxin of toxin-antitoxin system
MIRVVLDTNVIFQALYSGGNSAIVLDLALEGTPIKACVSTALLLEYQHVMEREAAKINARRISRGSAPLTPQIIAALLDTHTENARNQRIHFRTRPSIKDPDDEMVLELAQAAGAILITTNRRDFVQAEKPYRLRIRSCHELRQRLGYETVKKQ